MDTGKTPQMSSTALLNSIIRGGVVWNEELALKIGELLIQSHYGDTEFQRQRPFSINDEGGMWRISGSFNKDRKNEGIGPAIVVISKSDGRVLELAVTKMMRVPKEALDSLTVEEQTRLDNKLRDFYGE